MEVVDAFVHPAPEEEAARTAADQIVQARRLTERLENLSRGDFRYAVEARAKACSALGVSRSLVVVIDPSFLASEEASRYLASDSFRSLPGRVTLSCLAPLDRDIAPLLERFAGTAVKSILLHPILQRIGRSRYPWAVRAARAADHRGLFVVVGCAYGTRRLYEHEGLKLALALTEEVACAIVLAHGGGLRVLEATLLAADCPRLILDTSFSLPYYVGSSIEQDFAFSFRKLGTHRWMFGSDSPFVPFRESLTATLDFFERHGFDGDEVARVMSGTANRLLEGAWDD